MSDPASREGRSFLINREWLQKWSLRLLSVTGTQVLLQLLSGIVAIVLVRTMAKEQYAWFTIASSMAAVLSSLNDGGMAIAVATNGGKIWQQRTQFSALIHAALNLLHRTAVVSAFVATPFLVWLLHKREAPWLTIVTLVFLVVGPQWLATRVIILSTVNRLHTRIRELQVTDLGGAFTRCLVTLLPAAFGFINIYIAFAAIAASVCIQSLLVRRQVAPLLDVESPLAERLLYRQRIIDLMWKMYPNNVFNCVQSQLATGLLSVLGTTALVADLGALTRLSFISNFIAAPMGYIIAPAFARCQDLKRLRRLFVGVLMGYLTLLAAFVGGIWWQAPRVLSLFGPKYAHLEYELLLVAIALSVGFANQVFWVLNFSRGWVRWVWINIPLTFSIQIVSAFLLDINTVAGAAKLMIATSCANLLLGVAVTVSELHQSAGQKSDKSNDL